MKYTGPVPQTLYRTDPAARLTHGCEVIVSTPQNGFLLGYVRSRHPNALGRVNVDIPGQPPRRYPRRWCKRVVHTEVEQVMIGRL